MDLIIGLVTLIIFVCGCVLAVAFIAIPFMVWYMLVTLNRIEADVKAIKNRTDT
jgi:ABC-type molybdate transport system permease subunit